MEKLLYDKYEKAKIASLPCVLFDGRIVVVVSESEAAKAVDYLLSQDVLGIDTETRPSFRRGTNYKVSLLQVSSREVCFLFRLNHIKMCDPVKRLLEDEGVLKVGLSLHDDIAALKKLREFKPGNFFDLQKHVNEIGIEDLSLQKIYANLFGQKISKAQRLTNWEADILSDKQKGYAATDAWSCIKIYEELKRLEATGEYKLIRHEDNVQESISKEG
ncbi:MAG: 3'-5' exonuclease domain-containing protein 2 [Prevotella sp.]|nr:3'-5' exonuclease domain-containing protein 2 [Prevotella sp.]MDD5895418.1 3'-5' exonuclease domain-containing protein 2 [Prevotellaceae bacterium]